MDSLITASRPTLRTGDRDRARQRRTRGGLGGSRWRPPYGATSSALPSPQGAVPRGGAVFFPPGPALRAASAAAVSEAAGCRRSPRPGGLAVRAWTCSSTTGARSGTEPRPNAFGDRYVTELASGRPAPTHARSRPTSRRSVLRASARGAPLPEPRARLRARALLRPAQLARAVPPRPLLLRALPRGGAGGGRRRRCRTPRGTRGDRARVCGRRPRRRARARRVRAGARAGRDLLVAEVARRQARRRSGSSSSRARSRDTPAAGPPATRRRRSPAAGH